MNKIELKEIVNNIKPFTNLLDEIINKIKIEIIKLIDDDNLNINDVINERWLILNESIEEVLDNYNDDEIKELFFDVYGYDDDDVYKEYLENNNNGDTNDKIDWNEYDLYIKDYLIDVLKDEFDEFPRHILNIWKD